VFNPLSLPARLRRSYDLLCMHLWLLQVAWFAGIHPYVTPRLPGADLMSTLATEPGPTEDGLSGFQTARAATVTSGT
jgi:hypothetical protein